MSFFPGDRAPDDEHPFITLVGAIAVGIVGLVMAVLGGLFAAILSPPQIWRVIPPVVAPGSLGGYGAAMLLLGAGGYAFFAAVGWAREAVRAIARGDDKAEDP